MSVLTHPAFQAYLFYSAILAVKILVVACMTSLTRMKRKIFANPEDAKGFEGKVKLDDLEVERVRRAHLNDLENIPVFWVLAALYLTTAPAAAWATLLFRIFTVGRIIHTVVYAVVPMPQPTRALAFGIPYLIMLYMGIQVVLYHATAM